MKCEKKILFALIALWLTSSALHADQELQTCDRLENIDYYYCLGASRAVPFLLKEIKQSQTESTAFKDLAELATNLNLREAVPALTSRLSSAPSTPHNYDSGNKLTRQDLHYAAKAILSLEGARSVDQVVAYLRSLGEYQFTGSAWEDTVKALTSVNAPASASYVQDILNRCKTKQDDCAVLLPVALDLAISARATHLIPAFRAIPTKNLEHFTSSEQSVIESKRMILGDRELRKWFRDALLPRIRYWRENGGGLSFPVVYPDRYLEGARDASDMEMHASLVLGPLPEEADASFRSILYFLDHPAEYPDYALIKADLFRRIKRDASISPVELENEKLPQTFDFFMKEVGAGRDLLYRQVLLRYGDPKAGAEILAIFERLKAQPETNAAWLSAETALLENLNPSFESILELLRLQNQGKGDEKTVQYREDFVDAAALKMPRPAWVIAMLDSNVYI